jgi:hypothetical protein
MNKMFISFHKIYFFQIKLNNNKNISFSFKFFAYKSIVLFYKINEKEHYLSSSLNFLKRKKLTVFLPSQ